MIMEKETSLGKLQFILICCNEFWTEDLIWFQLIWFMVWRGCKHDNELPRFIRNMEYADQLSNFEI
jgi:hypothetical protein